MHSNGDEAPTQVIGNSSFISMAKHFNMIDTRGPGAYPTLHVVAFDSHHFRAMHLDAVPLICSTITVTVAMGSPADICLITPGSWPDMKNTRQHVTPFAATQKPTTSALEKPTRHES